MKSSKAIAKDQPRIRKPPKQTKPGDKLECNVCGHGTEPERPWIQRGILPPIKCPRCQSTIWYKKREG